MDKEAAPASTPTPRPSSSIYSDDIPIMTSLTRLVSEEARVQGYQTIATYTNEIQALEKELALHRREWNETIMLVNEVIKAIMIIKKCLLTINTNEAKAERDWLAFWGIYQESVGSHPPFI